METSYFQFEPPLMPLFEATNAAMAHQIITNILLHQRDQTKAHVDLTFLTVKTPVALRRDLKRAAHLVRCTQTDLVLEPLKVVLPLILSNQHQIR